MEKPSPGRPLVLFLDQKDWINLSRGYHNRSNGVRYRPVVERLLNHVKNGTCRIPISISHLIEHSKETDAGRRQRLAEVFEVFSCGWFFAAVSDILPLELRRAVARTLDTRLVFPPPEVFGRGIMFGIGDSGRAALSEGSSFLSLTQFAEQMRKPGAVFDILTTIRDDNRLRQNAGISAGATRNAEAAEELRQCRRPYSEEWRRAQAAGYTFEFQNQLMWALAQNDRSFQNFIELGPSRMTEFFSLVPTLHVDCELLMYRDKQWTRRAEPNDLNDIWYLIEAVPYCDIVVTEKFWCRAIQERGLSMEYRTVLLSDLNELLRVLPE